MMNNYEKRLDAAVRSVDTMHESVRIHLHLLGTELKSREPDQDDWDDTMFAVAHELRKAEDSIMKARRTLRDGS